MVSHIGISGFLGGGCRLRTRGTVANDKSGRELGDIVKKEREDRERTVQVSGGNDGSVTIY